MPQSSVVGVQVGLVGVWVGVVLGFGEPSESKSSGSPPLKYGHHSPMKKNPLRGARSRTLHHSPTDIWTVPASIHIQARRFRIPHKRKVMIEPPLNNPHNKPQHDPNHPQVPTASQTNQSPPRSLKHLQQLPKPTNPQHDPSQTNQSPTRSLNLPKRSPNQPYRFKWTW